jgi:Fur family transcriptional regulator, iron response regulator
MRTPHSDRAESAELLRRNGIVPTPQRIDIAHAIFSQHGHLSADQILGRVNASSTASSKATVYNTLKVLLRAGLVREVIVDPTRVFYDPNTEPHHHFYVIDSGDLVDIPAEQIRIDRLPDIPAGTVQEGIDVVVRVRSAAAE